MKKLKYYISGNMTGMEKEIGTIFQQAEDLIAEMECEAVNPAKVQMEKPLTWPGSLKRKLRLMLECTHVFQIGGWQECPEAQLENYIAERTGMTISHKP